MIALQARMQASYQDHVAQTQGLNAKVSSHTQILQFLNISIFIALLVSWLLISAVFPFFKKNVVVLRLI